VTDVSRETSALVDRYSAVPGLVPFAEILATRGVQRGLIGPREVDRIWSRHVANCAVVAQEAQAEIHEGSTVGDVGSGAGLPGIVWALVRPDLTVTLIEPLLRRATFLSEVVDELALSDRVSVIRARAEDLDMQFHVVTARAVARLSQLAAWTLPLTEVGGWVIALKGAAAADEVTEAAVTVARLGGQPARVVDFGAGVLSPPTRAVLIHRTSAGAVRGSR
jgi:16S rRNA (guanine527-N7)-methyltransferase